MKYFLNAIIITLLLIIITFGWSISKTLIEKNSITRVEPSQIKSTTKIKLFENYDNQTLKVGILNGCGVSGIGNQFSEMLNSKYGLVIENILTILGMTINDNNVEFNSSYDPQEDIQIIIGKDYSDFLNLNQ